MVEMDNCVTCARPLRRVRRHVLSERFFEFRREFAEHILQNIEPPHEVVFDGSRSICHACWHRINEALRRDVQVPPDAQDALFPVPGFTRVTNTSRRCMVDDCNNDQLRAVPNSIKVCLLSYHQLHIPQLARICLHHLMNTTLEDIPLVVTRRLSNFNASCIPDIVSMYTLALEHQCVLDFNNINELTAEDLHFWTGLNHEQFNHLYEQLPSLRRQSPSSAREDLGIYLSKIRTGEPSVRLGIVFNKSRQTIDRRVHLVRDCLLNDFVPIHLGFDHITREEIIQRNRILPNHIFGSDESPKAILICDGSYIFIQQSSNFLLQKLTYSLHKFTNLIKPFLLVCGDGHIIEVAGPYAATSSDATIMKNILQNHDGPIEDGVINYLLEAGDIFIVDRGFRDAVPTLETHGYVAHMPPSNSRGQNQLTCEEANKSRLITICRWVVETINGRFKRDFKIFKYRVFNRTLHTTMSDFRIAAALINCFQEPFEDSQYTDQFIQAIDDRMNRPNLLADHVIQNNLNRQRAAFVRMEANDREVTDFPTFTRDELILFAVGTYHVKIAASYCSEHIKQSGVYNIELFRNPVPLNFNGDECKLLRCRIKSRHVSNKTYYTYILYKRDSGKNGIAEYYCSCIHGQKTLGCCAHVMSVIYYLGWARHQGDFAHPAISLQNVILDLENDDNIE